MGRKATQAGGTMTGCIPRGPALEPPGRQRSPHTLPVARATVHKVTGELADLATAAEPLPLPAPRAVALLALGRVVARVQFEVDAEAPAADGVTVTA